MKSWISVLVLAAVLVSAQPPASFDLRSNKCAPPIINQGTMGSSAITAVVSATQAAFCYGANSNKPDMPALDAQYLASCSSGAMSSVLAWMKVNGTVLAGCEGSDPKKYVCPFAACASGQSDGCCVKGKPRLFKLFATDQLTSVAAMQRAIYTYGVITTGVSAANWQTYTGGIEDCAGPALPIDHYVYLVGWGTDSGKDYWIAANSWGSSWGEKGYIRVLRGSNSCQIERGPNDIIPYYIDNMCGFGCKKNSTLCLGSTCNTCTFLGCA
jgi:hypothetical protein